MTHNGPVDTIRSSSLLLCASKEGYETPQQQWMSLLIAYHSISHAKRVPQSGILGTSLRVDHSRNDTVWTTRGSYILQEAPPTLLIHLRPHMNHFNNNGCHYPCSTVSHFSCRKGTLNIMFCVKFESQLQQKWHNVIVLGLADAVRRSPHLPYTLNAGCELLQQQWMSFLILQHPISCAEGVPQIEHFMCNLSVDISRNCMVWTIRGV